jgi:fucose permease
MQSATEIPEARTARPAAAMAPTVTLAFLAFISLGLPDGLLAVSWPSMRETFGTSVGALGALLVAVMIGYLLSSVSSGWVVARTGVGLLLALSSYVTAAALLGYALAPTWWTVVLLGLLAGMGAGAVDAGVNAYAALHYGPRFLNWLHASFGLGATLGPILMMWVLGAGYTWRWGYAIVGVLQIVLGSCFVLTARQWGSVTPVDGPAGPSRGGLLSRPVVWLSVALFFLYTGIEATAGQWPYTLFTEARGISPVVAGLWVSAYWGCLTVGRLLFGLAADHIRVAVLLRIAMVGVLCGAMLIWLNLADGLSLLGLALMGFFAAPIFPSLIASTPDRIGPERAASVVGYQVGAASLGIGLGPALAGVLAERLGLESIPPFLVLGAMALLLLHEWLARRGGRSKTFIRMKG